MNRLVPLALLALALHSPQGANQQTRHGKLFPPENIALLEAPDREVWQRPEQIMDALNIAEGSTVADIGAASGWFTLRLARRVQQRGCVYAEDIQPLMIEVIKRRMQRENITNVRVRIGTQEDPNLPEGEIDAILIVEAYHEMEQPVTLLRNAVKALKPKGRIGIVDFTKEGGGPGPLMDERVDPERVINEATSAGLRLIARPNFLRYQYMLVFERANAQPAPRRPARRAETCG